MKNTKEKNEILSNEIGVLPKPITKKEFLLKAPSAFTSKAHPRMTDRYKFIDTQDVVDHLTGLGFVIFDADQLKFRDKNSNEGYQLHGVSMFHPNLVILNNKGTIEEIFEIIITNSYNGYSKCSVYCSFYRVSSNTDMLCISEDYMKTINSLEELKSPEFFNTITNYFIDMVKDIKKMKETVLSTYQKQKIAKCMAIVRHQNKDIGYDAKYLLKHTRPEDRGQNLWTVYNVVQEKLIKGYGFPEKDGEKIGRKIRAVNHFELSINFNKSMFAEVKKFL